MESTGNASSSAAPAPENSVTSFTTPNSKENLCSQMKNGKPTLQSPTDSFLSPCTKKLWAKGAKSHWQTSAMLPNATRPPLKEMPSNVAAACVTPNQKPPQKNWFSSPTDSFLSPCTQKLWAKDRPHHPVLRKLQQEALKNMQLECNQQMQTEENENQLEEHTV